jgi:t-SNARE complex subunit (syntaxin)
MCVCVGREVGIEEQYCFIIIIIIIIIIIVISNNKQPTTLHDNDEVHKADDSISFATVQHAFLKSNLNIICVCI